MGMVLSFSPRAAASGNRIKPSGELAAVIIFPGVRYERLDRDAAAQVHAPREPSPGKSSH